MDWVNEILVIRDHLESSGYDDLSKKILNAQLQLGTPGEMILNVMQVLEDIKENEKAAFTIIKNQYENILFYLKSIGYY